jgi:type III pantothenate kinase
MPTFPNAPKTARLLADFLPAYNGRTFAPCPPAGKAPGGLMLLTMDVGNTNVTLGIFESERLVATWRIATDVERLPDEYSVIILTLLQHESIPPSAVTEAVMACVVPDLEPVFEDICRRCFGIGPLHVTAGVRTGLRILYDSPRDVGADRVADAVAAIKLYGPPLIVVDFGTATVFDAINAEGDYVGGAIAPGLGIASEALFRRAAKLQRVELHRPETAIGRNTVGAIQSGILFGYVGLVEGIVARIKEELGGTARVIGTGGWADIIARETDVIEEVDKQLTLTGLRLIHEMNKA